MATADQILARVLVRCGWPSTNAPLTSAEILALADDEITGTLWPQLHAAQGDWHLAYEDTALVASQAAYRLPARMWGPVKDLLLVDSQGRAKSLSVCNIEELGHMDPSHAGGTGADRFIAYLDGDSVGLFPTPASNDTAYTLRVRYYRAPNTLCLLADASIIEEVGPGVVLTADEITIDPVRDAVWDHVDFIAAGGSHQTLASLVLEGSFSGGGILNFYETIPATVKAGDYVSSQGTTPFAQIPSHMVPQLVHRVALQCLNSNGDAEGFSRIASLARDSEARAMPTISPRQEAEPKFITPRNSPFMRWRS